MAEALPHMRILNWKTEAISLSLLLLFLGGSSKAAEIHDAVVSGDYEKAKILISADPSVVDAKSTSDDDPLLHEAIHWGYFRIAELLVINKADVNAKAKSGDTPLLIACHNSTSDTNVLGVISLLLTNKADPNVRDKQGNAPLHKAAKQSMEMIKLLLEHGAQINATNYWGKTPLFTAVVHGNLKIVQFLLEHGAEPNAGRANTLTPLHMTAASGSTSIAECLLEKKADPNALDGFGKTPLDWARTRNDDAITQLLIKYGAKEK
jgi:ankyrin repeat protein